MSSRDKAMLTRIVVPVVTVFDPGTVKVHLDEELDTLR